MKDLRKTSLKDVIYGKKPALLLITAVLLVNVGVHIERRTKVKYYKSEEHVLVEEDLETISDLLNVKELRENPSMVMDSMRSSKMASEIFARTRPASFIAHYEAIDSNCSVRPYKPSLLLALQKSIGTSNKGFHRYYNQVSKDGVLLVFSDEPFLTSEIKRALLFVLRNENLKEVCFINLSGNVGSKYVKGAKKLAKNAIQHKLRFRLITVRSSIEILGLVNKANMVLLHGSSSAALAALLATKKVYFSEKMRPFAEQDRFRWAVSDIKPTNVSTWAVNNDFQQRFSEMGPVYQTCCAFSPFGKHDDEKIVCTNGKAFQSTAGNTHQNDASIGLDGKPPCWVLALGCGNKWNFENSVIEATGCVVQTFDCTGTFQVPVHLRNRVEVHKLCIGVSNETGNEYRTLSDIIKFGSKRSGLKEGTPPALVKMDVEGWEHPVLHEILEDENEALLPEQMVIEIHVVILQEAWAPFLRLSNDYHDTRQPKIEALFKKLEKRGYVLIHRADNPRCPGCTEINVIKRSGLPEGRMDA